MVDINPATDEFVCPVCGTINEVQAMVCKKCMTPFQKGEDGAQLQVKPIKVGKLVDGEEPEKKELTKEDMKNIDELTAIPGIDRRKAYQLWQLGITSLSDLISKTVYFGDHTKGMSRLVANRIVLDQISEEYETEERKVDCPVCDAPIPAESEKCPVCAADLTTEIMNMDIDDVVLDVSDAVGDIFDQLSHDKAFLRMPEELRAQVTDMLKEDFPEGEPAPAEAGAVAEGAGAEPEAIVEPGAELAETGEAPVEVEPVEEVPAGEVAEEAPVSEAPAGETPAAEAEAEAPAESGAEPVKPKKVKKKTKKKVKKVTKKDMEKYVRKLEEWKKKGFSEEQIATLEALLQKGDLAKFKKLGIAMLKARIENIKVKKLKQVGAEMMLQCPECEGLNSEDATECEHCGVLFG